MSALHPDRTLIIGIGNAGRRDDGLGWAFVDWIKKAGYRGDVLYRYQLQIEDAEVISNYHHVIFIDASRDADDHPFAWRPVRPSKTFFYTTHRMLPGSVLALCREMYGVCPASYVLLIGGKEWGLKEGLSDLAHANLARAFAYFSKNVQRCKLTMKSV